MSLPVSLIMPVRNGGQNFVCCLAALAALRPPPLETIIVDDGSQDGSLAVAQRSAARVLRTARPSRGPAAARNLAACSARGAILFFVDADVRLAPDAVGRVQAEFDRDPQLAALYGSYDRAPAALNFISQYKNLLHHFVHQDSAAESTSFWAGCGAIRRDVFQRLGGFDAGYRRPSIEDIELGYRLRKAGCRTRLVKSLQASHLKRWTLRSLLVSDVRDRALPWTRLILNRRDMPADLNLTWPHRISAVCACLLVPALLSVPFLPGLWPCAALCALLLLLLNRDLYAFFAAQRGSLFALAAIALHWLYYVYSTVAFALGALLWLFGPPG